ncbi:unnamed protein product [Rhizophagus irregularis]|nr:unnamed protein product [Rhizophagus irregularis]
MIIRRNLDPIKRRRSTESPQQSTESLQSVPSTPPQAPRDLSPLMTTPNKRPLERKIQQYSEFLDNFPDELFRLYCEKFSLISITSLLALG